MTKVKVTKKELLSVIEDLIITKIVHKENEVSRFVFERYTDDLVEFFNKELIKAKETDEVITNQLKYFGRQGLLAQRSYIESELFNRLSASLDSYSVRVIFEFLSSKSKNTNYGQDIYQSKFDKIYSNSFNYSEKSIYYKYHVNYKFKFVSGSKRNVISTKLSNHIANSYSVKRFLSKFDSEELYDKKIREFNNNVINDPDIVSLLEDIYSLIKLQIALEKTIETERSGQAALKVIADFGLDLTWYVMKHRDENVDLNPVLLKDIKVSEHLLKELIEEIKKKKDGAL